VRPAPALRALGLAIVCAVGVLALGPARVVAAPEPQLSVRAAALIEESTGRELYGSDAGQELAIASTTKLMTALITLEHVHRLGTLFTQNDFYPASQDSQIGLVPGERMSVHDLLLAMLLPSADDAAEDLAYNIGGGSVANFVAMMNARAVQLGLTHTRYSTPIGLDTPGNYSSADDLVTLARYLLLHEPFFRYAVSRPAAVLTTGNYVRNVVNLNDLVTRYWWIHGVKTGHTLDAGYVLVGAGTWHGMTLISAVLGTDSEAARDDNTVALLDWGFDNFRLVHAVRAGASLARATVHDQPGLRVELIAARSYSGVVPRDARVGIRVQAPAAISGPLPRHKVIGTAVVLAGGTVLARIPLLLAHRVPAVSPLTLAARFITRPSTLVLLVLLLAAAVWLMAMLSARRRNRMRRASGAGPEPA
jgi:serine-type D-Ala-D-Ala carboxypeptidase (penicillin-binding protein 5/6)